MGSLFLTGHGTNMYMTIDGSLGRADTQPYLHSEALP